MSDMQTETKTTIQRQSTETYSPTGHLSFIPIDETVYPYIDAVRAYLEAEAGTDINEFDYHHAVQAKAVYISWELTGETADRYILEIARKGDYTDAETVGISGSETFYSLKYLLRDMRYYLRLTVPGKSHLRAELSFRTTYLGPRFLDVGGLYHNCRDLGGYKVGDKTILYNMIIRGSSPDNGADAMSSMLSEDGAVFFRDCLKIRTQIDFRGNAENCGRTTSSFKDADYIHIPLSAYGECFLPSQAEFYAQTFRLFANADRYPIYFHCVGGADRTGTVAALLLAFLGVNRDEIIEDYVVTSFSPVCFRQDARSEELIMTVLNGLNGYSGTSLSEKAQSYLISVGLTQEELRDIRSIMFGTHIGKPNTNA